MLNGNIEVKSVCESKTLSTIHKKYRNGYKT